LYHRRVSYSGNPGIGALVVNIVDHFVVTELLHSSFDRSVNCVVIGIQFLKLSGAVFFYLREIEELTLGILLDEKFVESRLPSGLGFHSLK